MAEEGDDVRDGVNHLRGVGFLAGLAVDFELHIEVVNIGDLVGCEKIGAEREEAISPFAVEPVVEFIPGAGGAIFFEGN